MQTSTLDKCKFRRFQQPQIFALEISISDVNIFFVRASRFFDFFFARFSHRLHWWICELQTDDNDAERVDEEFNESITKISSAQTKNEKLAFFEPSNGKATTTKKKDIWTSKSIYYFVLMLIGSVDSSQRFSSISLTCFIIKH